MKAYLKEIKFESTKHTSVKNITPEVNESIKQAGVKEGFCIVNSKHTTLGLNVQEISEPNLIDDMVSHCLRHVHEDCRSTQGRKKDYPHPTTDCYKHYAQDNPYCDEVDDEYDTAGHIRTMIYSHPSLTLPIKDGKLNLGKYQEVAVLEFDGRDGTGKNAIRQRTVQIWIYPLDDIEEL